MSYRIALIISTLVATWGMEAAVIARSGSAASSPFMGGADLSGLSNHKGPETPPVLIAQSTSSSPAPLGLADAQRRLQELGYYNGPINNEYGEATSAAITQFQEDAGLAPIGVLDPQTQTLLLNAAPAGAISPAGEETAPGEALPQGNTAETQALPGPGAETTAPDAANSNNPKPSSASTDAVPFVEPGNTETADSEAQSPATASETAADPAAAASDNQTKEDSGGLFRLALLGAGIVVIGGIGGAALLFLSRRGGGAEASSEEPDDALEHWDDPDTLDTIATSEATHQTPASTNGTKADQTSSDSLPEVIQNGSSATHSSESSLTPTQTTHQNYLHPVVKPPPSPPPARLDKVNIIDELIQDLENPDPTVRRKAIWELGQRGNSTAVNPLVSVMVNADSREQSLILAALAEISMQTLKPMNRALTLSLKDDNPEVRKNAIRDLTRVYDLMEQAGRVLGHAANDSDPEVRQTAQWALEQLSNMRFAATDASRLLADGNASLPRFPGEGTSRPTM